MPDEEHRQLPPDDIPVEEGKTRFSELDIAPPVLHAIRKLGFEYCTEIQAQSLPSALKGRDVGGKAQTGTGKTAAFLIAAFNHMLKHPQEVRHPGTPRVVILAPTRELALQIGKDAEALGKFSKLTTLVVYGGLDYQKQLRALEDPVDILVATPGRLIDYIGKRAVHLGDAEILIIDEADRMLDMGFIPDVRRIVHRTPKPGKRQTMLYSATLTGDILRLVDTWMDNPEMLEIDPENLVTDLVDQRFYSVSADKRIALLLSIMDRDHVDRMLVFANRRDTTDQLARELYEYGVDCGLLSGDVPQRTRLRLLEEFRAGTTKVIVATDVAARGIHVDNVSHVINYDLPYEPEDYVHRIGRTGRAGESGKAISFVDEYGAHVMMDLEEYLDEQIDCERADDILQELPDKVRESKPRRGGGRGRGRSGGRGRGRSGGGGRGRSGGGGRGRSGGRGKRR